MTDCCVLHDLGSPLSSWKDVLFFKVCFKSVLSPLCCLEGHSWIPAKPARRDFFFFERDNLVFVIGSSEPSFAVSKVGS